jgi:hypothetical protein
VLYAADEKGKGDAAAKAAGRVRSGRSAMADHPDNEPIEAQIYLPQEQMGGVWANFARVSHSEHEFTLDFVRLDFSSRPVSGVVVARVGVSPLFITQLIDALGDNWEKYAEKALPREVREHGDQGDDDQSRG